jgi:hypothetical protein
LHAVHTIGRCIVERKMGDGGMAELWLARLPGALGERRVAVKTLLPQYAENARFVRMLTDEARLAARLSHPNIVDVLDLGREGERVYIVRRSIPAPSTLASGVPPELDAIVQRALQRVPELRYCGAAEMRADLERLRASRRWEHGSGALVRLLAQLFDRAPGFDQAPPVILRPQAPFVQSASA